MTSEEKKQIIDLRNSGKSYKEIAKILDVSKDSVSAFLRRNSIKNTKLNESSFCKECGAKLMNTSTKRRVFCSDKCRINYWKKLNLVTNLTGTMSATCKYCGKSFKYYGKKSRKYCSRDCYLMSFKDNCGGD